jgi:hypothetical protein
MILDDWFNSLLKFVTRAHLINFFTAVLILFGGIFIAGRARNAVGRLRNSTFSSDCF